MKQALKRVISAILVLVLCMGAVPVVSATGETQAPGMMDVGELTIDGTNSFGNMLAEDLSEYASAAEKTDEFESGYSIAGLEIVDGVATVQYDTAEPAELVVAIYTEDGLKMITSEKVKVTEDENRAEVTFSDTLPEYFRAAAYLVDTYDYSPLCASFETPLYTQAMQELLHSTTEDYDADLVLNFDDNIETNFAVYAKGVKQIPYVDGKNLVTSIDEENLVYVIENADEQFTSLTAGDIVAYTFAEDDLLIFKVASIVTDGTTVTVYGMDVEMEEVFAYVKVEGSGNSADIEVDTTSADESVIYEGLVENGPQTFAFEGETEIKPSLQFKFLGDPDDDDSNKPIDTSIGLEGVIGIELPIALKYYVSLTSQFIDFKLEPTLQLNITLTGTVNCKIPLGEFAISPCAGLYIGFRPKFVIEFTGELEVNAKLHMIAGFQYDNKKGFKNTSTEPTFDVELEIKATLKIGIDWTPNVTIVDKKIATFELETFTGVEVEAKMTGLFIEQVKEDAKERHACMACVDIHLSFNVEIGGKITLLNMKRLTFEVEIAAFKGPLGDAYFSIDKGKADFGKCPYREYRTNVLVKDLNKQPVASCTIKVSEIIQEGVVENLVSESLVTDENGLAIIYLPAGKYRFETVINGTEREKISYIDGRSARVVLNEKTADAFGDGEGMEDEDPVFATGTCGDNVQWELTDSGVLHLFGEGATYDYDFYYGNLASWREYRMDIYSLEIDEGITQIGSYCFYDLPNLEYVSFPDSLEVIGGYAFDSCSSLKNIHLEDEVKSVGIRAFQRCTSLEEVTLGYNVTEVMDYLFSGCKSLTKVAISPYATYIGPYSFYECTSLESVNLPEDVTVIEMCAFALCSNLKYVYIPEGVQKIGAYVLNNDSNLIKVYYGGTQKQWDAIDRAELNNSELKGDRVVTADCDEVFPEEFLYVGLYYSGDVKEMSLLSTGYTVVNTEEYRAVVGGEYELIIPEDDGVMYKTASFENLVPEKQYVFLALKRADVEDKLDKDNLLYIAQGAADEDGKLTFAYIPRIYMATTFVVVCGASEKDLADAEITFPLMGAGQQPRPVQPVVTYNGEVLVEGEDYVISGDTDYMEEGEYTCIIRGIYEYTGTVECTYTVLSAVNGDITGDGELTLSDATWLFYYINGITVLSEEQLSAADFNNDGEVELSDAARLFYYINGILIAE